MYRREKEAAIIEEIIKRFNCENAVSGKEPPNFVISSINDSGDSLKINARLNFSTVRELIE